ncbi:hypothetical protein [Acinetobacter ihumii]|uniref:hypothetical protein n=1 Tax=Acinetobacter ihumii TaxID=2483802 RepID=UPI0010318E09|nr:hypothetical protein [Acinetobacter ihumii]
MSRRLLADFLENHRLLILAVLVITVFISTSVTVEFENIYSDSISISVTVLAAIGLVLAAIIFLIEKLESICNP